MKIFLVGGAVRDQLLSVQNQDRDWVVVGETLESMIEKGYTPIHANEFPIFIRDGEEYALARRETKNGHGYHGFDVHCSPDVSLEEDLSRRDLTINAIAQHPLGYFVDPFDGIGDIERRILRHTSMAFKDDPVRVLRLARFVAQLAPFGFTIADETVSLARSMVESGEIDHLTTERVWKETEKALKSERPSLFFSALRDFGALRVLMPEIDALFGVPQPEEHHPEIDTGVHTLMVLDEACKITEKPHIRFAALVHDLGKGVTPQEILPRHHGHEEAGLPLLEAMCKRLKVPTQYRKLAEKVMANHTLSHRAFDTRPGRLVKLFTELGCLNKQNNHVIDEFLMACLADARGRKGRQTEPYQQAEFIKTMHRAATEIAIDDLTDRYKGADLGFQINQRRIHATCKAKTEWLKASVLDSPACRSA